MADKNKKGPKKEPNKAVIAICTIIGIALGLVYLENALFGLGVGLMAGLVLGSIYANFIE